MSGRIESVAVPPGLGFDVSSEEAKRYGLLAAEAIAGERSRLLRVPFS